MANITQENILKNTIEPALRSRHITLIRTPVISSLNSFSAPITTPLALAYLSSSILSAGYEVTPIDGLGEAIDQIKVHNNPTCRVRGLTTEEIIERIPSRTDIIGISVMFTQEWLFARKIIENIKKVFPHIPIILGGEHATALSDLILKTCPAVDLCAMGEGEETIIDIMKWFPSNPEKISGIVYRDKDGQILRTPSRARIRDLESIPWPDWRLLPLEPYLAGGYAHGPNMGRTISMLATRGCPFQCTFCSNKAMWTQRYITRNPKDVVAEIEYYKNTYAIDNVDFADLTAIVKKEWIIEFGNILKERNIKISWSLPSGTRSEALDSAVTKLMAETSCKYLVYAAESGSPRILKYIKKEVNLDRMLDSIKAAKKNGLSLRCNLMLGFPKEKRTDVWRTLIFQIKLAFAGVDDVPLYMFSPYPGSELFDYLKGTGRIVETKDEYFQSLLCQFDLTQGSLYCENIGPRELNFYRLIGMSLFYFLSYILYPKRIIRSYKNIFKTKRTETAFEQRLVEMFETKALMKRNKTHLLDARRVTAAS